MRKTFRLDEIDCAACAAKLENEIKKIDGVDDVRISFFAQKMTISADGTYFDRVMAEVFKVCKKLEPDCRIIG